MSAHGSVLFDLLGELMGQPYDDPRCFWGRPSIPRETQASGDWAGSKHESPRSRSPSQWRIQLRLEALRREAAPDPEGFPSELTDIVTGCFTPFIGVRTAAYQVPRVARNRDLLPAVLEDLIQSHAETTPAGERCVDVTRLNTALDDIRSPIGHNDAHRAVMGPDGMATNG